METLRLKPENLEGIHMCVCVCVCVCVCLVVMRVKMYQAGKNLLLNVTDKNES